MDHVEANGGKPAELTRSPPNQRWASRSSRALGVGNPLHISTTPSTTLVVRPSSKTLKAIRGYLQRETAGVSQALRSDVRWEGSRTSHGNSLCDPA